MMSCHTVLRCPFEIWLFKEELIDANEIEKKKYYPETDDINGDLKYEWEDLGYTNGWETSSTIC